MNFDHRNPRLRRGFAFVALAALLGLAVVGLSQCRLVDDSVTGVDLQAESSVHGRNSCVHICIKEYKACLRAEKARHKAALKACGGDDDDDGRGSGSGYGRSGRSGGGHHGDGDRDRCRKEENLRHKVELLECFKAFKDCKANCYNEGAGSGGQ
jgi:hypothetical protein